MIAVADVLVLLEGVIRYELSALVAELVLDLVPQLDVPGQVLVRDGDSADGTSLFWHQSLF